MEIFFLALADKTRLRLLNLMCEDEIRVSFLVDVLGENQPKISRHLAYLRSAGIVEARRDGKWIHYKIIEPTDNFTAQMLRHTLVWLESQEQMQDEYKKLVKFRDSFDTSIVMTHAPQTNVFAKTNTGNPKNREMETFLL